MNMNTPQTLPLDPRREIFDQVIGKFAEAGMLERGHAAQADIIMNLLQMVTLTMVQAVAGDSPMDQDRVLLQVFGNVQAALEAKRPKHRIVLQ